MLTHTYPPFPRPTTIYTKTNSYRVALRDKSVTYLNKHGRFLGPHELEVVDAKGERGRVTAARFVIAVGGRPQPLACPGGELAITSDDVFSLEAAPGKTCVVGAGYVALECAGFLRALGHEVSEKERLCGRRSKEHAVCPCTFGVCGFLTD